jgi:hypothetical protein
LTEDIAREDKEKFWKADAEDIIEGVENRMQEGRGVLGLVDKDLPNAIEELDEK